MMISNKKSLKTYLIKWWVWCYLDYNKSSSYHKSSVFFFYFRSRLEDFFINNTIFWFSSHNSSSSSKGFLLINLLSGFLSSSLIIRLQSFLPVTWSSIETHLLLYRVRIFSLVSQFSSLVFHYWIGRFFIRFLFKSFFNNSTFSGAYVWKIKQL